MPTVSVFEDELKEVLGQDLTEESFDQLCFEFGLELDEVTSEYEMYTRERGYDAKEADKKSKRVIYKVDVPANRYDLLCLEGLTTALKVFRGLTKPPTYTLDPPVQTNKALAMTVSPETAQVRPYVVCAILRGIQFDEARYQSFIDLQDKLHQNICRRRTLASMDRGSLHLRCPPAGPFTFVPLGQTEEMDGNRMMEVLSHHQQLKAYLPIIKDAPLYPVIRDAKKRILSLPPIINSEFSKITLDTRDVFIECTCTDLTKGKTAVNMLVTAFSQYSAKPFTVEPVPVTYSAGHASKWAGRTMVTPDLTSRVIEVSGLRLRKALAIEDKIGDEQVASDLTRMFLPSKVVDAAKDTLQVTIPVTRSDVMHECDLIEDLAISYGYNNLDATVPLTVTFPKEQPINRLSDLMRSECAMAGFCECLTWVLLNTKENYDYLRRDVDLELTGKEPIPKAFQRHPPTGAKSPKSKLAAHEAESLYYPYEINPVPVQLSNPKTRDFEICRTSLIPCLLKVLQSNKHNPPPIKLFEVSDVVIQSSLAETGARNERRLAALIAGTSSGFETIHGLLNQIMWSLNLAADFEENVNKRVQRRYHLEEIDDAAMFPGRQAKVMVGDVCIGILGVLHPEVLEHFDMSFPASVLEITLEPFLEWLRE
ncbi:hypothetical protein FOZ62_004792 [Perkinsus olseni]|uniref:phenylalanine--tRNA ligase n=3 Tax=Perkinsus olseni TaxID=32597 RepID=A0A7J6SA30_PEROL|nr:hypothetical protein FOZ62_004792 [Perkinsus olseni]